MATIDHHDVQGNILKGYAKFGYVFARYVFFRIETEDAGRKFVTQLLERGMITTGEPWDPTGDRRGQPQVTTNVALTYAGLTALGLPRKSLQSFPPEFAMGMKPRREILGDDGRSAPEHWDPIWRDEEPVHLWIGIAGLPQPGGDPKQAIRERYEEILQIAEEADGMTLLSGHIGEGGLEEDYQEASVTFENGRPSAKEHFGYVDGISDPYFKGRDDRPEDVLGMGKPTGKDPATLAGWAPLETGEFILGYKDEAFEYPLAPIPRLLSHNGSYMVYRKLHENVGSFEALIERVGAQLPGGAEEVAAKFAGRWRNGAPLTTFRNRDAANVFIEQLLKARETNSPERSRLEEQLVAFDFRNDLEGAGCPRGAHIRRANPRGALEFGQDGAYKVRGALIDRRRLARRGLPYGRVEDRSRDDGNHGIVFMAIGASISRQFEFVQQQWLNYGNDFRLGSSKDVILGNHGTDPETGRPNGRAIFEAAEGDVPFFCGEIPRLVETRGGDYFFVPSLTALRMMGEGIIDPT